MRSVLVRGFKSRAKSFGLAALLVGALAPVTAVWAQEGRQLPVRPGATAPNPSDFVGLRQASAFDLFGDADLAMIGIRHRGSLVHNFPNDGGLLDYYFVLSSGNVFQNGTPTGQVQWFFMGSLYLGAPKSEWEAARQVVPSLNNATGGGWVSTWNINAWFFRLPTKWTPADDQLGLVHSGAAMTADGSCLDFSDDFVDEGAPLMASSDCPDTWGTDQFAGAGRLIRIGDWEQYFNDVGPCTDYDPVAHEPLPLGCFTWDWWRVPPEYVSDGLIGDWQTYGRIVDWGSDVLSRYGSVMPGGAGDPEEWGWPMGISVYFDAYSFANPAIANVTYFRTTIVNESELLYGVPLDYDSLYFGVEKGELASNSGGGQGAASYWRPETGAVWMANPGENPACNGARIEAGAPGCPTGDGRGLGVGGIALIFLNSPLGDLRNKAFSDPASPFYAPGHPLAGDTITFNQGRKGGWGGQYQPTTTRSARAGFGYHSGIIEDLLDGRTEADLDATANWYTIFANWDYPVRTARYNKYVPPGNWDWNHDGVLDTLTVKSCLGAEFGAPGEGGCSELWSDTLPGRLVNGGGNFGGFHGFGPFPLAAGDTTRWTMAVVTGPSGGAVEANARNAVATYMNAYLRPNPATPPNIVSVATTPGDRGRDPGATVQLFWDDVTEEWVDEFMLFTADQLEGTALAIDNPWLQDSLRAQASSNVAAIHVFKSCDNGGGFTDDTNCQDDPATDPQGDPVDLGWQPYETFVPDENGAFPNAFVDEATTPGKTYLYSVVTETVGFTVNVFDRDADNNLIPNRIELVPRLFTVLSTSSSDPNVASVYVPASREAGGAAPSADFTDDDPLRPTEYYPVEVLITSDIEDAAAYDVVFGDSVVVSTDGTTWTVEVNRTVVTSTDGGATLERVAYETVTYPTDNANGVQVAGGVTDPATGTTVFADELTMVALTAGGEPLFASSVLDGANTTPGTFLGRSDFPRFLLNVDNTGAGDFESLAWFEQITPDSAREIRIPGTSGEPTLNWLGELDEPTGESYNTYIFDFQDHEYGPGNVGNGNGLFTINLRDPEGTDQDFQASLDARTVATTTSTTPDVAAALGVDVADLLAVDLPFTIRHEDPDRSVIVAMQATDKAEQIPLGQNVDQINVTVPANKWVPGESITLLENIQTFQRAVGDAGEYVVTQDGQPVVVDTLLVTWDAAVLGCSARRTCNPVQGGTRGADAGAHLPAEDGQFMRVRYLGSLTPETAYGFSITATVSGEQIMEVPQSALDSIFVVPNPYVVFSAYEQNQVDRRLLFRGLPACPAADPCTIEIYTVAGQFVQRITYDIDDLAGNGDLFWNMRTRENTDLQSGLYLFVVTGAVGPAENGRATGQSFKHLGKFVIIR